MAQYSFGANGGALTVDDKGVYTLTDNGTVLASAGIFGGTSGAAYFNGTNQYFTNTSLLTTTVPSAIAISLWFKAVKGQPSVAQLLMDKSGASGNFQLAVMTTGLLRFQTSTGTNTSSQTILPAGQTGWYHLVANQDTVNGMRLWVNGVLESSNSLGTTLLTAAGSSFFISSNANFFNGWISQFKVMNKVLTQADVDQLYSVKYTLPTALLGKDYQLEAHYQKNGVAAMDKIIDMKGLVVSEDVTSVYRAGFTAGSGLNSADKIKVQGRI